MTEREFQILVVWDRLLGTYRPSSSATHVDVGLGELDAPPGLAAALLLLPLPLLARPS